eukprot:91592-Chlamydomonas_euryale.AAC.7
MTLPVPRAAPFAPPTSRGGKQRKPAPYHVLAPANRSCAASWQPPLTTIPHLKDGCMGTCTPGHAKGTCTWTIGHAKSTCTWTLGHATVAAPAAASR